MVDLTAGALPGARPLARMPGLGQRLFWRGYDSALLGLTLMVMSDMPNRWGLASEVWLMVYGLFVLRAATVWRAFYRQAARNWTLMLYPGVCLLSVIWSGSPVTSAVSGVQMTMTVLIAMFLGWRFAPRQLVVTIWALLTLAALASLGNWATGVFQPVYSDVGGLLGIYTSKNMLGHYSQFAAQISLTLMLMGQGHAPRAARWLAPLTLVLCVLAVVLSKSMTAVLLLPLYGGLTLLLNRRRLPPLLRHGAIAALVLALSLGPLALAMAGIDPVAEVLRATGKDATLTGRTELWSIAYGLASQAPLTGLGFGAFWAMDRYDSLHFAVIQAGATAPSFHNFIADVSVGTGLMGLGAMFALLGTVLSRALRHYRASGSALSVGCLILVLVPMNVGLLEPYLYRQHEFMLMWLVMLGVSIRSHLPPFVVPAPVRHESLDVNESR